jgi:hypothetical protein
MRKLPLCLASIAATLSAAVPSAHGEAVKDREGAVRGDRERMQNDERWIYEDYQKGFAEARRTGKPLLIVLRCVPCLACMGLDTQVLLEDAKLAGLLDQFVCVRLINANDLDLALFQFDYDLSFTTLFFNGDGTLYGRYGSWKHQKSSQETATEGLRKSIEGALAIHQQYPANKAALAPKQGLPTPFKTPTEIPMLAERYKPQLDWEGKVAQSCVHCHMIGAAYQTWHRSRKEPMPERWLHPWPEPETVGLTLATEDVARVTHVAAGSPAARAGLQPDDHLLSIGAAPLISIADVSWALHCAPETASLEVKLRRGEDTKNLVLTLPQGWRRHSDVARRVSIWPMRGMALGGLRIEPLDEEKRRASDLPPQSLAMEITAVGQYGMHAAAKKAGFRKDDIIIEIDGKNQAMRESEIIDHLLTHRFPGEKINVTVIRAGNRQQLQLPMQ